MTPIALQRDSRTFRQAASLARFGYESMVVEGERSESLAGLPFAILDASDAVQNTGAKAERATGPDPRPNPRRRVFRRMTLDRLLPRAAVDTRKNIRFLRRFFKRFTWVTFRRLPPASLYVLHSFSQFPAVYLRCLIHRVPFIYDAHDFYPVARHSESRLIRLVFLLMEKLTLRTAAAAVTSTEAIAEAYAQRFRRRPDVIRNCHDLRIDEPVEQDVRAAAGLSNDAFLLVSVGNVRPILAHEEMLDALAKLPDRVHLAVIGGGSESLRASVLRHELSGRVHLLPAVAPTQITAFTASAEVAAMPYADPVQCEWTLGNRLFHAVAAGQPVLYPPMHEMRRLCERYELGLLTDPRSPDSIASAVRELSENPGLVEHYRANVRHARDELNWEREESGLKHIVERTLAASR